SIVDWVVKTVMPAMLPGRTPWVPRNATAGSKIASASPLMLVPSRTESQSAEGSADSAPAFSTPLVTMQVYVVFSASGLPGTGRMASTFGMRLSAFHLSSIGTSAPVAESAHRTESAYDGAKRGDGGSVAGSIGPEKKK